ncbi:MAG TPA: flagellar biosynthetic protein FliQ [Stellaceae bacterium]|nr:flagellar biosynthetic protein FliQ [Stellaceae bacterium]
MSTVEILSAAREMLVITLLLMTPFLGVAMLASLVIGLLQASTRMNDLTLSFVPRFFAVLLVVYLSASWATRHMSAYVEHSMAAARTIYE